MENKIKVGDIVIAPEGCETWLTPSKEYTVVELWGWTGFGFKIEDDNGKIIMCRSHTCAHLFNQPWIIKK